jgi:2-iminoacetate synthase ThiH
MVFPIIYNGIDRVDNDKGYLLNNCVGACKFCNFAKKQSDLIGFKEWIDRIKNLE